MHFRKKKKSSTDIAPRNLWNTGTINKFCLVILKAIGISEIQKITLLSQRYDDETKETKNVYTRTRGGANEQNNYF